MDFLICNAFKCIDIQCPAAEISTCLYKLKAVQGTHILVVVQHDID